MGGYARAPLDFKSLSNGIAKFEHLQVSGTSEEAEFALAVLDFLFPLLCMHSSLASDEEVTSLIREKSEKAAGDPWRVRGVHNKGQALDKFGLEEIERCYREFTPVISSTLKDELRPVGKDARLFRPQDVGSYVEGARLFHHQNLHITETHRSPVFCKFVVPGQDIPMMFNSLKRFGGDGFAADGSQWDAHFPLFVAAIIAAFRIKQGLPAERVERYYSYMYAGYTLCADEVLQLIGQPSGHFNTSVDNSLGHIVLMAIHAHRCNMTVDDFVSSVKFYSCGDDLIWSTRTLDFWPLRIQETYNSFEVYLEFQSLLPLPVEELIFVGVKSATKMVLQREIKLFTLVSPRSFASLHIHKRKTAVSPLLKLCKFASLAILWFCDEGRYNLAREMFQQELAHAIRKSRLSAADASVCGLMRAIEPNHLLRQYMGWERKSRGGYSIDLRFGPSWNTSGGLKERCRKLCGLSLVPGIQCSVRLRQERTGV